ncbi:uncharacterized protein LTR77_008160 [Saxophila tyrrhenica]|uniref:GAT domain-containing protein n=1 Tax=Saxophila tyrrhenica TaxID=1690608 RepID=A0AAV9P1Z5_9PEZI|nr:hypothetical protein LTR77_008160 [Saxophila tyrrhenica]
MSSKMKGISRFTGFLGRSKSVASPSNSNAAPRGTLLDAPVDSPDANVVGSVRQFCESGSMSQGGEEVLHLPVIVEAAESSPTAAASAARQIRTYLTREWSVKSYVQYNAVMLIRILSDNPGPSFTRNFDKAFVSTIKEVLRNCKDGSTQQILRETLDNLEANKSLQEGLEGLIMMWRKEKGSQARLSQQGPYGGFPPPQQGGNVYGQSTYDGRPPFQQRASSHRQLPPQQELASRIEEARNTAKILLQLIQSTPPEEVVNNDLLAEFADRCQSAQRSMQGFINCNAPPPDDDTMLTLIETNEQLSLASSRHHRAQLSARKAMGLSPSPHQQNLNAAASPANGPYQPPAAPPPAQAQSDNLFAQPQPPPQQPPQPYNHNLFTPSSRQEEPIQPPPGPPPGLLDRLNSREAQQSPPHSPPAQFSSTQPPQASNPFADPVDHDTYHSQPPYPAHRPHSQTFSINAEPSYPSNSAPAPPQQERPALGAWHNSTITPSFLGRQDDAAQGMTMHGAGAGAGVEEIDGHSEVGRTGAYDVSPVEARQGGGRFGGR